MKTQKQLIEEALKMTSIPHFDQMKVPQMISFFEGENWEFTEKADGSNVTFGVDEEDRVYVKSKRGRPATDPNELIKLADKYGDIFIGFADLLTMLKNNEQLFKSWYNKTKAQYTEGNEFQLFGELFNKSTVNVIEYSEEMIGSGAVYLFIVKYITPGGEEIDISDYKAGKAIQESFKQAFHGVDGWNIYTKQKVDVNIKRSNLVDELVELLKANQDLLQSRKRADKPKKDEVKQQLADILSQLKKDALEQIQSVHSVLGADEIEGVIVRNVDSGAIAKLVDTSGFGARRVELWGGIDGIKVIRKELLNNIQNNLLHNADIFVLPKKQIEKLADELELRGDRYSTVEDLLSVLLNDAIAERPQVASKMADVIQQFPKILNQYLKDIDAFVESDEVSSNFDTYQKAKEFARGEKKAIGDILAGFNQAKQDKDKYFEIIKFFLGDKGVSDLKNTFLQHISI